MIPPCANAALIYGKDTSGNDVPIGVTAAAQATGTLTSDNTVAANNDTVTIDGRVYTFKTALTPSEGEVLIVAADADGTLLNLINAINLSGSKVNGVDYYTKLLTGHPSVTAATSVTSHTFVVTARDAGASGNSIATTETSGHLSWGATTLTGGVNSYLSFVGAAGTALLGKVGIDQTSPGNTNGTQSRQYSGVPSNFTPATADATVFTLAAGEIGFIQNLSADAPLAVKKGASASTSSFSFILNTSTVQDDGKGGFVQIDDWIGAVSVAKIAGTARYIAWKVAVT